MSKLWKYEKNFRFFQICRLEYPLNTLMLACTTDGSRVSVPWCGVHYRWVIRVCSVRWRAFGRHLTEKTLNIGAGAKVLINNAGSSENRHLRMFRSWPATELQHPLSSSLHILRRAHPGRRDGRWSGRGCSSHSAYRLSGTRGTRAKLRLHWFYRIRDVKRWQSKRYIYDFDGKIVFTAFEGEMPYCTRNRRQTEDKLQRGSRVVKRSSVHRRKFC